MLKVYATREAAPREGEHTHLLAPFFGVCEYHDWGPMAGCLERWCQIGPSIMQVTSDPSAADIAVLPADWGHYRAAGAEAKRRAADFVSRCREHRLPTIVFYFNDDDGPVELEGVTVFRTSMYRSKRRPFEHAQPAWCHDVLARHPTGNKEPRQKPERPVVGFCGFVPGMRSSGSGAIESVLASARLMAKRWAVRTGLRRPDGAVRAEALRHLASCADISTNFIIRGDFLGAVARDANAERLEYVSNILSSDYVLCARGIGNYSWRLYEVMSCGRIPILVDTDCALPCPKSIDWNRLCVIVDAGDLRQIGRRVMQHFESMSDSDYEGLQASIRAAWIDHLSADGFFAHLVRSTPTKARCQDGARS